MLPRHPGGAAVQRSHSRSVSLCPRRPHAERRRLRCDRRRPWAGSRASVELLAVPRRRQTGTLPCHAEDGSSSCTGRKTGEGLERHGTLTRQGFGEGQGQKASELKKAGTVSISVMSRLEALCGTVSSVRCGPSRPLRAAGVLRLPDRSAVTDVTRVPSHANAGFRHDVSHRAAAVPLGRGNVGRPALAPRSMAAEEDCDGR